MACVFVVSQLYFVTNVVAEVILHNNSQQAVGTQQINNVVMGLTMGLKTIHPIVCIYKKCKKCTVVKGFSVFCVDKPAKTNRPVNAIYCESTAIVVAY